MESLNELVHLWTVAPCADVGVICSESSSSLFTERQIKPIKQAACNMWRTAPQLLITERLNFLFIFGYKTTVKVFWSPKHSPKTGIHHLTEQSSSHRVHVLALRASYHSNRKKTGRAELHQTSPSANIFTVPFVDMCKSSLLNLIVAAIYLG